MIKIGEPISVNPPKRSLSWERREYPSPDQKWVAIFKDPYEWRMGAVAWKCSIAPNHSYSSGDITESEMLYQEKMLHCPMDQAPWRDDSLMLSVLQWREGLILFDLPSRKKTTISIDENPMNAQWSPRENILLIRFLQRLALLNGVGEVKASIPLKSAKLEHRFTCWLPSGDTFLVVGRTSRRAKPRAGFYQSPDGNKVKEIILDPNILAPYDIDRYQNIPRGKYSLIISSSTMSVGNLLDRWNQVFYDSENQYLYLSVYRPIGEIIEVRGIPACKVSENWFAVPLSG